MAMSKQADQSVPSEGNPNPKDIFIRAISLPKDRWASYIRESCGDNAALRQRVDALIAAYEGAGGFLERPDNSVNPSSDSSEASAPTLKDSDALRESRAGLAARASGAERVGTVIGPYKLHEVIGEGGFGVVYLAEQEKPVRRRVALKIIKLGMDTRQVIARVEQERQALAIMDHPNIAKVLDAGATETGRPYFVMELVRGTPITTYCDTHNLTPEERLSLFVSVCQAVQ